MAEKITASEQKTGKMRGWEAWYEDAKAYYREHGDLLVPSRYLTPEGYKLGRWIERQRAIHNGVEKITGIQTTTQVRQLEKIGMVWKLENRFTWEQWICALERYRDAHGDLLIPSDYRDGDMHLGNWIREQRKRYWKGALSEEQTAELDSLGMVWQAGFRRDWALWYEDAKEYYETHGNLLVPLNYQTKEGFKLGIWIFGERDRYKERKGRRRMTDKEKALLEQIGMVWSLKQPKK